MASRNYLEVEPKPNTFFGLMEESDLKEFDIDADTSDFKGVTPNPGYCVKAKTDNNEKVFINVCHCPEVPPPPPSLDVWRIIHSAADEESLFHFPLSLGEVHIELDKSGNECKCYDVVINSGYFQETTKLSVVRDFILTLACSGLERKYNISLDIGTCSVLNKPYHGKMPLHFIRLQSRANTDLASFDDKIITDEDAIVMPIKDPSRLITLSTPEISRFDLFQTPASGNPSLLIFQGLTSNVTDGKSLFVFVSERKLTVRDTKCKSLVSVALPYTVIPEKALSNFWKNRLFVAMPVAPTDF